MAKRRGPVRNKGDAWAMALKGIVDKRSGAMAAGRIASPTGGRMAKRNVPADSTFFDMENGVLNRAAKIVDGRDKQQHYGPPEESMSRIAQVWSGILGRQITAGQVALMMAGLKLARLGADPEHADSLDDLAGYARIYERVK